MKHTNTHTSTVVFLYLCLFGVFLYKGGYPGCCVGSPTEGAKGEDIVNKSKFLSGLRIELASINLEIVCLSLCHVICLPCMLKSTEV